MSVADAKNKLPELIKEVEDGEPVTICRRGVPVVDIVRTTKPRRHKRVLGTLKGKIQVLDSDWSKPMPDAEVEAFLSGRVRLLLDTAILIYAVESPERLSKRAISALENKENILELSAVSLLEIAIKTTLGKLRISAALARQAVADLDVRILPYTAEHAFHLFELPLPHGDPFDRQIIAQALSENIPIVTSDKKFRLYKGLKAIW